MIKPEPQWIKSSYSGANGGQCLEWAPSVASTGAVPVRDSKHVDGPVITFGTDAFAAFVGGVRNGSI